MTLPDRQPTMVLYPQGTCTHTTLRRSSLLPFSNGLLRKPSGYITGLSEPWQPHTKTSMHSLGVSTHCWEWNKFTRRYYVGPCHVECVVNAAGVIFQVQVRAFFFVEKNPLFRYTTNQGVCEACLIILLHMLQQ